MTKEDIEKQIGEKLALRNKRVVNRNALLALFGAFTDPLGSLGKIFLKREDALAAEKQHIEQEVVLELLCKIDTAISEAGEGARAARVTIAGLIETSVVEAESVTGVKIGTESGPVCFAPGTQIKTSAQRAKTVTGLHIE